MPDREKVIRGLEFHKKVWKNTLYYNCEDEFGIRCPYEECRPGCTAVLASDALALLKEQEKQLKEWEKHIPFLAAHGILKGDEDDA